MDIVAARGGAVQLHQHRRGLVAHQLGDIFRLDELPPVADDVEHRLRAGRGVQLVRQADLGQRAIFVHLDRLVEDDHAHVAGVGQGDRAVKVGVGVSHPLDRSLAAERILFVFGQVGVEPYPGCFGLKGAVARGQKDRRRDQRARAAPGWPICVVGDHDAHVGMVVAVRPSKDDRIGHAERGERQNQDQGGDDE